MTTPFFHYLAVSTLVLVFAVRVALAQDSSRESVLWQDDFESCRDSSKLFSGPAAASVAAVPEPGALSLAVVLLMGLAIRQRRRV